MRFHRTLIYGCRSSHDRLRGDILPRQHVHKHQIESRLYYVPDFQF